MLVMEQDADAVYDQTIQCRRPFIRPPLSLMAIGEISGTWRRRCEERTMKLSPFLSLSFNGQCEDAFKFYERCLGGKISFMLTWGDSPMAKEAPPEWGRKILHGRVRIGDTDLIGADALPQAYEQPRGFSVLLNMDDAAEAERIFHALAENGTLKMPLQKTFWALRYGILVDQFGVPWEINCEGTG